MIQPAEWQDTQQLGPNLASSVPANRQQDAETADPFPDTEMLVDVERDTRWWPEAVDGRCGANAAEFAASQPAPLSIV